MNIKVTYAHCIKATPGMPDREPHYRYEAREREVRLERVPSECADRGFDWHAYIPEDTLPIAIEDTNHDAVQAALYALMVDSREKAETNQKKGKRQ